LVHRVDGRRDPALANGAALVAEARNPLLHELPAGRVLLHAPGNRRAAGIAAQIHVHLAALRLRPGEAREVAAVLRDGEHVAARAAVAHLTGDLARERRRHPRRTEDRRLDAVGELLPAGEPGLRT